MRYCVNWRFSDVKVNVTWLYVYKGIFITCRLLLDINGHCAVVAFEVDSGKCVFERDCCEMVSCFTVLVFWFRKI